MARDLKDILKDDKAFETLLTQTMQKVGQERDEHIMDAISQMDEEEFRKMIGTPSEEHQKSRILFLRPTIIKAIAACAVILLVIVGINHFSLGKTDSAAYASLFNSYYKGDQVDWQTFDAGNDRLNTANQPSTAALLEHGTKLLSKKTERSTRAGIKQLELLLTLNYKKSLEHEIRWYLGLGYMRNGDVDKAIGEFERVISLGSPHSADARTLCKELRK